MKATASLILKQATLSTKMSVKLIVYWLKAFVVS